MVPKFDLISLFWLPQALGQTLLWIYWWQTKEYRWDRFQILFTRRQRGRRLKLGAIIAKIIFILLAYFLKICTYFPPFLFLFLDSQYLIKAAKREIKKPKFTLRAQIILAISLIPIALTALHLLPLIIGEILLIVSPSFGIALTALCVRWRQKKILKKTAAKLEKIKPVVIGITGSYGKTTTKEFVAHLLSQKYLVAKTSGNKNTPLGVSQEIIKKLQKKHQFLVVEMGAYKKGEIKTLAELVRPQVAVITGIGPQHLALFGSLEKIKEAKFELIKALPSQGIALFNFANSSCRQLAQKAKKLKTNLKILPYASSIKILAVKPEKITFIIEENSIRQEVTAPLTGLHLAENLIAAILIARLFKVSWAQIKKGCQTLKMPEKTMQFFPLKTGAWVIDDSYNANFQGFRAAINYLSQFKKRKKTVFTPGIIELGSSSSQIHCQLGRLMRFKTDQIILTDPQFAPDIKRGLRRKAFKLKVIKNRQDQEGQLKKLIKSPNQVILIEGRVPQNLTNLIKKYV